MTPVRPRPWTAPNAGSGPFVCFRQMRAAGHGVGKGAQLVAQV